MPHTHYLFEFETEREGLAAVRALTDRVDAAAREAGGALADACVTTDLDHVYAVVEVADGPALSAAVLRLALPGIIWFNGPEPVREARYADGEAHLIAEHDLAAAGDGTGGTEAGLDALRASVTAGAVPLTAWIPADGGTTALVRYGGDALGEGAGEAAVRAAAAASGATVERLDAVHDLRTRHGEAE